ncbi:integrase core domain-containing protein [Roseomonas sp. HF4]|uniref:integrase core domain-containing protein n=1 Tax=Roseomonas sp. HF4 TaxID=2562313 RepID=UPI001484C892|nr:integrase core domain-containing protein [Roseomonas sp. HF4]
MAEHFQQQVRFWGISPSYAVVGEPETNGVIERLFRTLKEQIVHGRVFETTDEVRDAVREFVGRYNAEWWIEKNGFRSPLDARAARVDTNQKRGAKCSRVSREPGPVQQPVELRAVQASGKPVSKRRRHGLADARRHAVEEVRDRGIERASEIVQSSRGDPVEAPLALLDLLERYPDCLGQRRLTHARRQRRSRTRAPTWVSTAFRARLFPASEIASARRDAAVPPARGAGSARASDLLG